MSVWAAEHGDSRIAKSVDMESRVTRHFEVKTVRRDPVISNDDEAKNFMRKTTLILNSIVVVFFACFLAYTQFARQHINNLARGFVTEKTLDYSEPLVDLADESLHLPLAQKLLSEDQATAIRREITDYRQDALAYISDLTRHNIGKMPVQNSNPLLAKVAAIKAGICTFYDHTLNALISDLRIFSISNLIAGLLAFMLAFRSRRTVRQLLVWFSLLMFVAVLYCSCLYVDELTFFRVLFRTHLGGWYPVLLSGMIVVMYVDYGRHANVTEQYLANEDADFADF